MNRNQLFRVILFMTFAIPVFADSSACKVTYDPETENANLPCVETSIGKWYGVVLKHQGNLVFSVEEAKKLEMINVAADDIRAEVIPAKGDRFKTWLFIEINSGTCVYTGDTKLSMMPQKQQGTHGKIDMNLFIQFCEGPPNEFLGGNTAAFSDTVSNISEGIYDIYINGELKKSVEVPAPDSKNQ